MISCLFPVIWLPSKNLLHLSQSRERMISSGSISELFRTAVRSGSARFHRSEELGGREEESR